MTLPSTGMPNKRKSTWLAHPTSQLADSFRNYATAFIRANIIKKNHKEKK